METDRPLYNDADAAAAAAAAADADADDRNDAVMLRMNAATLRRPITIRTTGDDVELN